MKRSFAISCAFAAFGCLCCVTFGASAPARAIESSGKKGAPSTPVVLWKGGTRIPSIDITPKGTLLAFAQHGGGDNHPNIIEVRRSTDGGKTWSKAKPLMADKSGRANPSPLVDHKTGTVWLFWSDRIKGIYQLRYRFSRDDGLTWSKVRALKIDDSPVIGLPSCNRGIQLSSGRLLLPFTAIHSDRRPVRHRRGPGRVSVPRTIYSDDGGKTWRFGKEPSRERWLHVGSSEHTLLELADGTVYMNHRHSGHRHLYRAVSFSRDGGVTWSDPVNQKDLLQPQSPGPGCHSGLARLTHPKHEDKSRVLFSSPLGKIPSSRGGECIGRRDLTVQISYDECKTWQRLKVLKRGPAAYSNLIVLPDKSIGCIYEGGGIRFARFTLEWLTDGKDKIGAKKK
jgi:sialidase-1